MKAEIVMVFENGEFVFGEYPFDTYAEQNRVNELAMKIREERDCQTFVREVL